RSPSPRFLTSSLHDALPIFAVVSGDTAVVPYGGGTWASRGMPIGGSATLLAGKALRERVTRVAAALLEAHAADVELGGGRATVRDRKSTRLNSSHEWTSYAV